MRNNTNLIKLTLLTTTILVNFFFYQYEQGSIERRLGSHRVRTARSIASKQLELFDCNEAITSIADPQLFKKKLRVERLRIARENLDAFEYLRVLRGSHDNYDIQKGATPKGFSLDLYKLTSALKNRTNNNYVSSYFQHYEPKDIDTWGIFSYVTKTGQGLEGDEAELVLNRLNQWIDKYASYDDRLGRLVAESMTDEAKLKKLKELQRTKSKEIKNFNYLNGNRYTVNMPKYEYNQSTKTIVKGHEIDGFSEYNNYKKKIKDLENIVLDRFATDQVSSKKSKYSLGNFFSEKLLSGGIYREVLSQAFYRRRLEFIRDALGDLPTRSLKQQEIFEKLDDIIHRPDLMPRSDAIRAVQVKEFRSEVKSFFKGQKSRRKVLDSFHAKLLRGFSETITEKNMLVDRVKAVVWASVFMAATSQVYNTLMIPVSENDQLLYYQSRFTNWLNDRLLEFPLINSTWVLHECAITQRQWTVENACLNNFLFSHLSSYFYESRISGNKDYLQDESYKKRRTELIDLYFQKREDMGYGNFFAENLKYLKTEGYRQYTALSFIDIVEASSGLHTSLNEKARDDIYEYLIADEGEVDKNAQRIITRSVGPEFMGLINEFKKEIPKYSKRISQYGAVREDIEGFLIENKELGLE